VNARNHQPVYVLNDVPDAPDYAFEIPGKKLEHDNSSIKPKRPQLDKFCQRTVLLSNLPENSTYLDVVSIVKGGMLLDVHLRQRERNASISFLFESAAQAFYSHAKRYDLYLKGKRVRHLNIQYQRFLSWIG
jgi:hypothetical protein